MIFPFIGWLHQRTAPNSLIEHHVWSSPKLRPGRASTFTRLHGWQNLKPSAAWLAGLPEDFRQGTSSSFSFRELCLSLTICAMKPSTASLRKRMLSLANSGGGMNDSCSDSRSQLRPDRLHFPSMNERVLRAPLCLISSRNRLRSAAMR